MAVKSNPTQAASKWSAGMAGATQAYTDGINNVKVAPGQLAAAQANTWVANVTAAKNTFATRVASVSLQSWQSSAVNKGAPRLASGASAAEPKFQSFLNNFLPKLSGIVEGLPARGTFEQNLSRLQAYIQAVHQLKGQVG